METFGMIWNEYNEDRTLKNIVVNPFKHFNDFHFWGVFLNMTYFGGGCLNIDLHNNILQNIFGSNFIFSTFKQDTLKMSL
jgi:hypothetical protein